MSVLFAALACAAEIEIPKASGKALGVTKGKSFSNGMVFVNGRYLPPPYVVERWGVGIRINDTPVIGSVIDWADFLKTQSGVKVTKTEVAAPPPSAPAPEPEPVQTASTVDDFDMSLDELFDDDPKPKKPAKKKPAPRPVRQPKPTVTVSYSLDGEFVPNDASKALLERVNRVRTEINAALMSGGFICFGDKYPRVTGDERTAGLLLEKLPDIMRVSGSQASFLSSVRTAGLSFLPEPVCNDLFRNRRDYIRLKNRRERQKQGKEIEKIVEEQTLL